MKRRRATFSAGILIAACAAPLLAQSSNPVTMPATPLSITPGPLMINVVAVQGGAQYRPEGATKWQALLSGTHLDEGTEVRTGPKGTIQFSVGTDQTYRVDRLTVLKILRASLGPDGTIKTDVGMQYGRVSKDVDAPVRPHEDTIVTPSSTLAVRGTRVSLYDQPPYEPEAISLTGAAVFQSLGKQTVAFGAKGQGTAVVTSSNPDPAGNALNSHLVDPSIANARTPSEDQLLADLTTSGAVVSISNPLTLPVVSNTGFPSDAQLPTLVQGSLTFYIRWNTNTHVEMELIASLGRNSGEFILPVLGLDRSPGGGHILFDNLGGPTGGFEVINYPGVFNQSTQSGQYSINAINVGKVNTTVTFDAFFNPGTGPQQAPFLNPNSIIFGGTDPNFTVPNLVLPVPAGTNNGGTVQIPPLAGGTGFENFGNATAAAKSAVPAVATVQSRSPSTGTPSAPAPAFHGNSHLAAAIR